MCKRYVIKIDEPMVLEVFTKGTRAARIYEDMLPLGAELFDAIVERSFGFATLKLYFVVRDDMFTPPIELTPHLTTEGE